MSWFNEKMLEYEKKDGVQYDLDARCVNNINHHPKSIDIFERIAKVDFLFNKDYFTWKSGGDGDNGELLMFILDIIFEEDDKK